MKNFLLTIISATLCASTAIGVPAYPLPQTLTQPDGSRVTFIVHGDETMNYITTTDGYQLVYGKGNLLCYAQYADGKIMASDVIATDNRTSDEKLLLKGLLSAKEFVMPASKGLRSEARIPSVIDKSKFRGLVVLVNYTDITFSMENPNGFYDKMINEPDFNGFSDAAGEWKACPGSLYDYFVDNSCGAFCPSFDVVGPVSVNFTATDVCQLKYANEMMTAALNAVDPLVDFADYDSDNDGTIDMVYFIFPGYGSNTTGGMELWPHASDELKGLPLDGKLMGHYACSTELFGVPGNSSVAGIGVICHEFSHLLGLPDEYDTFTGGMTNAVDVPGYWSVMSLGCYTNNCLSPVGYSLLERSLAGFSNPDTLSINGNYTLEELSTAGTGLVIPSMHSNEFFLLENRQPSRWDSSLPGHGLLIYRTDFSDPSLWDNNCINIDPGNEHYLLLRAMPQKAGSYAGSGYDDTGYDPFPGLGNVTTISDMTSPSLRSLYGNNSGVTISEISETDGIISFNFSRIPLSEQIEQWQLATPADGLLKGCIADWEMSNAALSTTETSAIELKKGASISSVSTIKGINTLTFNINNPTRAKAIFQMKFSLDGGKSWTIATEKSGNQNVTIESGSSLNMTYYFNHLTPDEEVLIMVKEFSGVSDECCLLGDLHFIFASASAGVDMPVTESSSLGGNECSTEIFDLNGRRLDAEHASRGIYIVRKGMKVNKKIVF
ncbi:MAG: M6 family metalloprotease domain-containing protein [Muribaculaceae bacterium]